MLSHTMNTATALVISISCIFDMACPNILINVNMWCDYHRLDYNYTKTIIFILSKQ